MQEIAPGRALCISMVECCWSLVLLHSLVYASRSLIFFEQISHHGGYLAIDQCCKCALCSICFLMYPKAGNLLSKCLVFLSWDMEFSLKVSHSILYSNLKLESSTKPHTSPALSSYDDTKLSSILLFQQFLMPKDLLDKLEFRISQ